MQPSKEQLLWMYAVMAKARYYEDTMAQAYMEGKSPKFDIGAGPVPGEMHLAAGQEPCAAGVCVHLRRDDTVTATHRPHHVAIAKGVDLNKMTAEIFGKRTGLAGGRGGHHLEVVHRDGDFVRRVASFCRATLGVIRRRGRWVAYTKSADGVTTILAQMGLHEAVLEYEARAVLGEAKANANRVTNFDAANAGRTAAAAARRVEGGALRAGQAGRHRRSVLDEPTRPDPRAAAPPRGARPAPARSRAP